jgi:hypothetical protein
VEASLQLEAKATAHSVLIFVALLKQSHSEVNVSPLNRDFACAKAFIAGNVVRKSRIITLVMTQSPVYRAAV